MVERIDAIPADLHAVGRVVGQAWQRMHEGRPGQRSEAAGGQARQHEASAHAQARVRRGAGSGNCGHGSALPASQAACRSAVYSGSGKCAASRLASVRQYAGETPTGVMPSASMASMRASTARTDCSPSACSKRRAPGCTPEMRCAPSIGMHACITMSCQRIVP
eukprot:Opistho-2@81105